MATAGGDYNRYLRSSWLAQVRPAIAERSDDPTSPDPDLYYNVNTGAYVGISSLAAFDEDEVGAISRLPTCDLCDQVRQKLRDAGYDIHVGLRLLGTPTSLKQLETAIQRHQNIDKFNPSQFVAKPVPVLPAKPKNALVGSRSALEIDKAYAGHKERVIELMQKAVDERKEVCIDVIRSVLACAGSRGIKELATGIPYVKFTYVESEGLPKEGLEKLARRYVGYYEEQGRLRGTGGGGSVEGKGKQRAASPPSRPVVVPQPRGAPAQRTVGGEAAALRTAGSAKLKTPAVASAPTRKEVGSTSHLIRELSLHIGRVRAAKTAGASRTLSKGVATGSVAPEVVPTAKTVTSTRKTVSVPVSVKSRQPVQEEEEPVEEQGDEDVAEEEVAEDEGDDEEEEEDEDQE
jgi:hypothetical protein